MKKFSTYIEVLKYDVTKIASMKKRQILNRTFIIFDTETTGLIKGKEGSEMEMEVPNEFVKRIMKTRKVYYQQAKAIAKNKFGLKGEDVQLTEIAALAITFTKDGPKREEFHKYVIFDKSKVYNKVLRLISWSIEKDKKAESPEKVFKAFDIFLNKFPKKIFVAHNLHVFDKKIIEKLGEKVGVNIKKHTQARNTILVDTKSTKNFRKIFPELLPTKISDKGKTYDVNNQNALLAAFKMSNHLAHTAIADTRSLTRLSIKMLQLLRKKK